jgi:hypothetical protein
MYWLIPTIITLFLGILIFRPKELSDVKSDNPYGWIASAMMEGVGEIIKIFLLVICILVTWLLYFIFKAFI